MNGPKDRPRTLREIEEEVLAEGREWMRQRLQQKLQEQADQQAVSSKRTPSGLEYFRNDHSHRFISNVVSHMHRSLRSRMAGKPRKGTTQWRPPSRIPSPSRGGIHRHSSRSCPGAGRHRSGLVFLCPVHGPHAVALAASPTVCFTLSAAAGNQAQLFVVPAPEAATVRPLSRRIKSSPGQMGWPELFPRGAIINFANTDLSEVVKLYAKLSGRAFVPAQSLAAGRIVNVTTQTPLSREEGLYAIETLLDGHGLTIKPVDDDSLHAELR